MLKIRLTRRGKRNKAFFRLVIAEHTSPIKGRFLEALGFLNPHTKEKNFKADRIKYWLEKGAQCSDTAHNLLVKEGIIKGPKRMIKMKKKEKSADKADATEKTEKPKEEKKEKTEEKEKKEVKKSEAEEKKEPVQKTKSIEAGGEKTEKEEEEEK